MRRFWIAIVVAASLAVTAPVLAEKTPKPTKCCRKCKKGKACGNGCISKKRKCKKPKGCACDVK